MAWLHIPPTRSMVWTVDSDVLISCLELYRHSIHMDALPTEKPGLYNYICTCRVLMHMWLLHTYLPVYDPAKSIRMHVGTYVCSLSALCIPRPDYSIVTLYATRLLPGYPHSTFTHSISLVGTYLKKGRLGQGGLLTSRYPTTTSPRARVAR